MVGTANIYSFAVNFAHIQIQSAISQRGYKGNEISYIFEAGHKDQKNANLVLDKLLDEAGSDRQFNFSFQNKTNATLLQAADILAWHCTQYIRRKIEGFPVRKDFASLLEIPHKIIHLSNAIVDGVKQPTTTAMTYDIKPQLQSADTIAKMQQIYKSGGLIS